MGQCGHDPIWNLSLTGCPAADESIVNTVVPLALRMVMTENAGERPLPFGSEKNRARGDKKIAVVIGRVMEDHRGFPLDWRGSAHTEL